VTNVVCTADYCEYWTEGNLCNADSIVVKNIESGREASTIDETMCDTFKMRKNDGALNGQGSGAQDGNISLDVSCTVDSCEYWGEGDRCVADKITVSGMDVKSEEGTACETYEQG
jgi:hypothetical protein